MEITYNDILKMITLVATQQMNWRKMGVKTEFVQVSIWGIQGKATAQSVVGSNFGTRFQPRWREVARSEMPFNESDLHVGKERITANESIQLQSLI